MSQDPCFERSGPNRWSTWQPTAAMALAIVADTLLGESPSARAQDYRAAATTTRSSFDWTKQLATGPEAEPYAAGTIYGRGAVAERAVRGSAATTTPRSRAGSS